jgi:hypothetical protein
LRIPIVLPLLSTLGLALAAQTPPAPAALAPAPASAVVAAAQTPAPAAAAAPAPGTLKWRGALWASGAASDRQTTDGSLFLRPMDAPDGSLALDGLQLGADVTLADGWSLKFTFLAGQDAKVLNAASQETGSIAYPEAMLVWTGDRDTLRLGRMNSAIGMEVLHQTQNATASRGLLFSFADPFGQVGLDWHHAFTQEWSTDVYLYNGEDQIQDNNKGKSGGLCLTYNPAGATDKFVTLMAYTGPEQNARGTNANTGAEGRKRDRLSMAGQWVWGASTLQWEGEYAREPFPASTFKAAPGPGNVKTTFSGYGFIYKFQVNDHWAVIARAETLADSSGIRLNGDPTIAASLPPAVSANLRADGFALGAERRWHATFTRLEVRNDHLNQPVQAALGQPAFTSATSLTVSVGTSF